MSEVSPPTENVPIFNPIYFQPSATGFSGTDVAFLNANYLKFPISQNSQELFSSGLATLDNMIFTSPNITTERQLTGINLLEFEPITTGGNGQITFPDGTIQNTAGGAGGSETLAQTLVLGNSAGTSDIDMNLQSITNATNITTGTLNYTTLNPPIVGGDNIVPNSINITSNVSPQNATTAITNIYNNNSAYSINNLFLNYNNTTGTYQYRQNLGKIIWNSETPDGNNIYLNMTFEWTFNFICNSNSFAQPTNGHPSFFSKGTFCFCPYWVQYLAGVNGISTMTAEQDSNGTFITWIDTSTGSAVSGGWTINPKITLEWNTSNPNEMVIYYLNQAFSSGGSSPFIENGRVDLNVKCLTKGGLPLGDPNFNDYYMEFDPTYLTGFNI
tara:strand:- start:1865 stop:3022 length:1158 start_codon:yes stop_codon:yes gene_type:complete